MITIRMRNANNRGTCPSQACKSIIQELTIPDSVKSAI